MRLLSPVFLGFLLVPSAVSLITPAVASAQIDIDVRVNLAPPLLPVYVQPPLPGPDFLWTPGYWAWDGYFGDYYWIPGTWVRAPRAGYFWTPAWWGWQQDGYLFHRGYWGPRIGFYGGVNYGFGYTGFGFFGGRWDRGGHFAYNRTVNNVNITNVNVTNIYEERVDNRRVTNVSFNGGPGGIQAAPTAQQRELAPSEQLGATPEQQRHFAAARNDRTLFAASNHGIPPVAATARAASFRGPGVVRGMASGSVAPPPKVAARPATAAGPRPAATQNLPRVPTGDTHRLTTVTGGRGARVHGETKVAPYNASSLARHGDNSKGAGRGGADGQPDWSGTLEHRAPRPSGDNNGASKVVRSAEAVRPPPPPHPAGSSPPHPPAPRPLAPHPPAQRPPAVRPPAARPPARHATTHDGEYHDPERR